VCWCGGAGGRQAAMWAVGKNAVQLFRNAARELGVNCECPTTVCPKMCVTHKLVRHKNSEATGKRRKERWRQEMAEGV